MALLKLSYFQEPVQIRLQQTEFTPSFKSWKNSVWLAKHHQKFLLMFGHIILLVYFWEGSALVDNLKISINGNILFSNKDLYF